ALFAVSEHLRKQGKLLAPGLDGYTLAFDDSSEAYELDYCRALAKHMGRPVWEIAPSRMQLDWCREQARLYRDPSCYPTSMMSLGIRTAARGKGSRALLSGVGGDQWLRGSRSYYAEALAAGRWTEFVGCFEADRRDKGL